MGEDGRGREGEEMDGGEDEDEDGVEVDANLQRRAAGDREPRAASLRWTLSELGRRPFLHLRARPHLEFLN